MRQTFRKQLNLTENWLPLDHARELEAISDLLDGVPDLCELAHRDLVAPGAVAAGAQGMTAEQVIRALIVKQMNLFSYRELAFHLADSRSYQTFCRFGVAAPPPKKSALAACIKALAPETLEKIHLLIVTVARELGIESGQKARVDTTVVEANIHHPTDSELLWDCVRVLTRVMKRSRKVLGPDAFVFGDRTRRAKRRRKEIDTARSADKRLAPYRDLIQVTQEVCEIAHRVRELLGKASGPPARKLALRLDDYLAATAAVLHQARRRVLDGDSVQASEKIVSIFETHTDIIRKDARDTYYGHKVCLTAGASSLVLDCVVLDGNPPDSLLAIDAVDRLTRIRGDAPQQVAFDGGFASKINLEEIKDRGVRDVVFAKGRGLQISDMAKSSWVYRRLRNFRAGIEGIISFLKRAFGLDRCNWRSLSSFKSYVWSSIIASNLLVIARHLLA